jgi:hypothetical protein
MDLTNRLNEEHQRFMASLERAVRDTDMPARAAEAYNEYMMLLQDAWNATEAKQANQAFENYRKTLSTGFAEAGAALQIRAAFTAYVAAVKEILATANPSTTTPAELAAIGQSLSVSAWMASNADAPGDQGDRTEVLHEQEGGMWGATSLFTSEPVEEPTT